MKCECGNETHAKDGVCAICAMDRHMNGTQPRIKKETTMAGLRGQKKCNDCGNDYKPTSNVQKRCPACAEKHKANKDLKYREAKKQGGRTVSRVAHNHEKAGSTPAPATKPVGAQGMRPVSHGGVLAMLEVKREELAQELAAVNTTILTLEKYA